MLLPRSAFRFGLRFMAMLGVAASLSGQATAGDTNLAAIVAIDPLGGSTDQSRVSTEQLRYTVHHSMFGDIGNYTNDVERTGDATIVRTTAHFMVSMLGVVMRREDDQRVERWLDGRLMSFAGVTRKNAETTELSGRAEGNDFVISSPLGTVIAPANVQPANPWSARCLRSTTMMRVDNGAIENVQVTGGAIDNLVLDGQTIPTRLYDIDGTTRYRLWFDQRNIPVMFVVDDSTGKITFTLTP
jgi:hypothetical protein